MTNGRTLDLEREIARLKARVADLTHENARLRGLRGPTAELEGPTGLRLRPQTHEVFVRQRPVVLTSKEFDVLRVLLERRGEVVTHDALDVDASENDAPSRNAVEAHISHLRRKLRFAGANGVIKTFRKVGYSIP